MSFTSENSELHHTFKHLAIASLLTFVVVIVAAVAITQIPILYDIFSWMAARVVSSDVSDAFIPLANS